MEEYSESTIDEIIAEEQLEKECRHILSQRAQLGRNLSRRVKINQIIENIKHNLDKEGPYNMQRARIFIENCELYPEVRKYAPAVLTKILDVGKVTSKRLECSNLLRRKMKEFQR